MFWNLVLRRMLVPKNLTRHGSINQIILRSWDLFPVWCIFLPALLKSHFGYLQVFTAVLWCWTFFLLASVEVEMFFWDMRVSNTKWAELFLRTWNVKWNLFWIKMTSSTITKSSKVNNTRAPGSKSKNSSSNPSQALIFCFFKIFSYWWHLGKSHLLTLSVLIYILGYNSERLCPLYACHESISASNFGRRKQRWSKVTSAVFLIISWSGWG